MKTFQQFRDFSELKHPELPKRLLLPLQKAFYRAYIIGYNDATKDMLIDMERRQVEMESNANDQKMTVRRT